MKFINNVRIGTRLSLGFGGVLLLAVAIAVVAWLQLKSMQDSFVVVTDRSMKSLEVVMSLREGIEEMRSNQLRWTTIDTPSAAQTTLAQFEESHSKFNKAYAIYSKEFAQDEKTQKTLRSLTNNLSAYVSESDKAKELLKKQASVEDSSSEAALWLKAAIFGEAFQAYERITADLNNIRDYTLDETKKHALNGQHTYSIAKQFLLVMTAIAMVVGALLAWALTRSVVDPLKITSDHLLHMAQGDLSQQVHTDRKDEIGLMMGSLTSVQQALLEVVGNIRTTSHSVSVAANQIASGNQDLSSRTEIQASNLERTSASMEELTNTVKRSTETAHQVDLLASSARDAAGHGSKVVGDVITTMQNIQQSSDRISEIINVIDGIAFQTNILALNAAVEAARAGEQGRGFAVVASEVRSLAQRSANAAKEIKTLITDSAEKVHGGSRLVSEAGKSMDNIRTQIEKVSDLIGEIRAAATEQSAGIEQVNRAVSELDEATQQNASLVQEASAAADSLKHQSMGLVEAVSVFRLHDDANNAVNDGYASDNDDTPASSHDFNHHRLALSNA